MLVPNRASYACLREFDSRPRNHTKLPRQYRNGDECQMFLGDYLEALNAMIKATGKYSCCYSRISASGMGTQVTFEKDSGDGIYYVYDVKSKHIYRCFPDTWQNPQHYEVVI